MFLAEGRSSVHYNLPGQQNQVAGAKGRGLQPDHLLGQEGGSSVQHSSPACTMILLNVFGGQNIIDGTWELMIRLRSQPPSLVTLKKFTKILSKVALSIRQRANNRDLFAILQIKPSTSPSSKAL